MDFGFLMFDWLGVSAAFGTDFVGLRGLCCLGFRALGFFGLLRTLGRWLALDLLVSALGFGVSGHFGAGNKCEVP